MQFLEVPEFRNVTLKCLSEIGGLQIGPEYNQKFIILFNMVMTSVNKMIPPSTGTSPESSAQVEGDFELTSARPRRHRRRLRELVRL